MYNPLIIMIMPTIVLTTKRRIINPVWNCIYKDAAIQMKANQKTINPFILDFFFTGENRFRYQKGSVFGPGSLIQWL